METVWVEETRAGPAVSPREHMKQGSVKVKQGARPRRSGRAVAAPTGGGVQAKILTAPVVTRVGVAVWMEEIRAAPTGPALEIVWVEETRTVPAVSKEG